MLSLDVMDGFFNAHGLTMCTNHIVVRIFGKKYFKIH